ARTGPRAGLKRHCRRAPAPSKPAAGRCPGRARRARTTARARPTCASRTRHG
ncbi:MAG: hypothetical protein AVDCRST_MAG51-3327, partial [uncultured Ramlibacter sp.]